MTPEWLSSRPAARAVEAAPTWTLCLALTDQRTGIGGGLARTDHVFVRSPIFTSMTPVKSCPRAVIRHCSASYCLPERRRSPHSTTAQYAQHHTRPCSLRLLLLLLSLLLPLPFLVVVVVVQLLLPLAAHDANWPSGHSP